MFRASNPGLPPTPALQQAGVIPCVPSNTQLSAFYTFLTTIFELSVCDIPHMNIFEQSWCLC